MKTKTNSSTVVSSASAHAVTSQFIMGLDLGNARHQACVLDPAGQVLWEGTLLNSRPALAKLLVKYPEATVALEAGTHSPWISRFLKDQGATVIVANSRKLHAISRHECKSDRRDAHMLARLAPVADLSVGQHLRETLV